jgi:hypothetical protein
MQEKHFPGLRITLGKPRVVTESVGYCWYPDILKFSTGELMMNYRLTPDSNESLVTGAGVLLSRDGGETWVDGYDVNGFHDACGEVRLSLPDGSIVGTSGYPTRPEPAGQWRRFAYHYWRYENGGRSYTVQPWGSLVEGLPRDVQPAMLWNRWYSANLSLFGSVVEIGKGRYLTTCYATFHGDKLSTLLALESDDEARTWHYVATIAGPAQHPTATEGCNEACLVKLADGELMCVYRVGSALPLGRSYSRDAGRTWSAPDALPARSVAPNVVRLENGVLALSTGRPGISLSFSTDTRGKDWAFIDVIAHHNAVLDIPHHIRLGRGASETYCHEGLLAAPFDLDDPVQTTAYTALLEASPNRLFLLYDRVPYGWMPVPTDAEIRSRVLAKYPIVSLPPDIIVPRERERIYLLDIQVERE